MLGLIKFENISIMDVIAAIRVIIWSLLIVSRIIIRNAQYKYQSKC